MTRLKDKIALITGGTTGIGLATAKRFAAEGAVVIVTGHNPDTLDLAREELGDTVKVVDSDAGDERRVAQLFETIRRKHGRVDILFLNAGIARFAPLHEAALSDFDAMWNVNVRGMWLALKYALPILPEGATVIVNSSIANSKGVQGMSAYAATKAAVRSLVRTVANELAAKNIRVNAISPGPIDTPIIGKLGTDGDAFRSNVIPRIPLGRIGSAEEVASTAAFLASNDASFITGAEIAVDGGMAQV